MGKVFLYDTTLRDGAQADQISFSIYDKLNVIKLLDTLGIDFVEIGAYDSDFDGVEITTENSKIVLFGNTCRVGTDPADNAILKKMAESHQKYCTLFGKSWDLHVSEVLGTTLEENLRMIRESIAFLIKNGKTVFFDAEHFFDGYKNNREYACKVLQTALEAGAERLVLCDTNGGTFPDEIISIVKNLDQYDGKLSIHAHDDCGFAVANSVYAVEAGCSLVQGTITGMGERCGNANLSAIAANLQLKKNYSVLPEEKMRMLTVITRSIANISNISVSNMPYVGHSAFSHKAGMHIDAVLKNPVTFEHVDPQLVGNRRYTRISEVSGKSALFPSVQRINPEIKKDSLEFEKLADEIKKLEGLGYQYEGAQASLDLLIRRKIGEYNSHFEILQFKVIDETPDGNESCSFAFVEVAVGGRTEIAAARSDGPVHALDTALRKALDSFYPSLRTVKLIDYKVRVMDRSSTGSTVRVSIDTTDGHDTWGTMGVSVDIIEASCRALADSIEYKLEKDGTEVS